MNPSKKSQSFKFKVRLVQILLYFLSFGAIIDFLYRISFFESDPAPDTARFTAMLVFAGVYLLSAILFSLNYFWARWLAFSFFLFMFLITLTFYIASNHYLSGSGKIRVVIELFMRFGILLIIILSTSWIKKYKKEILN